MPSPSLIKTPDMNVNTPFSFAITSYSAILSLISTMLNSTNVPVIAGNWSLRAPKIVLYLSFGPVDKNTRPPLQHPDSPAPFSSHSTFLSAMYQHLSGSELLLQLCLCSVTLVMLYSDGWEIKYFHIVCKTYIVKSCSCISIIRFLQNPFGM